jgi:predicted glycoside hydrolase/deacetylase ChbG (UPF0249 family)
MKVREQEPADSVLASSAKRDRGLLIVNADDWGGWKTATDAALTCSQEGRITSVSAMVFMDDSERAAELARSHAVDAGLHLNFNQDFTSAACSPVLKDRQSRTRGFLRKGRYAQLIYNPLLKGDFEYCYRAQLDEFQRLYGAPPSHFDGHQHMHLCANMLAGGYIPAGAKIRRNFSFDSSDKSFLNRWYRRWVDGRLSRRYLMTDYFFSLAQGIQWDRMSRISKLAKTEAVELMTHPEKAPEFAWLMGEDFLKEMGSLRKLSYQQFEC